MTVPAERGEGTRVVEWWLPEPGTAVRIRESGECQETFYCAGYDGMIGEILDVITDGEIRDGYRVSNTNGHRFCVHITIGRKAHGYTWFCVQELEPAGAPPPGDDGREG